MYLVEHWDSILIALIIGVIILILEYWVVQPIRKTWEARKRIKIPDDKSLQTTDSMGTVIKQFFSWLIFGKSDKKLLASPVVILGRLLLGMIVWAIIGVAITVCVLLLVGNKVITQYLILGAVGGAFFRGFLWPIILGISTAWYYIRIHLIPRTIDEKSIAIYPYTKPPYNAVEMKYLGSESIRDLEVWLMYQNKNGDIIRRQVEEFYPKDDPEMIWRQFKANFLNENEVVRFRLLQKKSTENGKVIVEIIFVGAKTGKVVKSRNEFNLVL